MHRHMFQAGLAAVGLVCAIASTASALDNRDYSGTLCNPTNTTEAGKISYGTFGVQNNSTSASAQVFCGVAPQYGKVSAWMNVAVVDRSSTADVCCTFYLQSTSGAVLSSLTRCSSGNSSGSQWLEWYTPTNIAVYSATIACTIPTRSSSGVSQVNSYALHNQ